MTHKLKSLFLPLVAIALLSGCQSIQRAPEIVADIEEHGRWYVLAREATFEASMAHLERVPYHLDRFQRVEGHMTLIIAADNINYDLIVRTLQQMPIRELESDNAQFWIRQGRLLATMAGDHGLDPEDFPLRDVTRGIRDGLNMAVSAHYVR